MNNFFDNRKAKVETFKKNIRGKNTNSSKVDIPDGLFIKCDSCNEYIIQDDLKRNLYACPKCRFHFRLSARDRIDITCDKDSFIELFKDVKTANPLDFPEYENKIKKYQKDTNEIDAFICGVGKIGNEDIAIGILDSFFMMGSMGSVVGEKVTRLVEYSTVNKLPLVIFSASGGARMQEGIFSLMQMAKTSGSIKYHSEAGLLFVSVLTNPTTGGVAASFASLGDIIIAEKGALIGFAGKRVIEQTIRQELPEGFQSADFQLEKGFVDMVIDRQDLKEMLKKLLRMHKRMV